MSIAAGAAVAYMVRSAHLSALETGTRSDMKIMTLSLMTYRDQAGRFPVSIDDHVFYDDMRIDRKLRRDRFDPDSSKSLIYFPEADESEDVLMIYASPDGRWTMCSFADGHLGSGHGR